MRYFKILVPALLCLCVTAYIHAQSLDKIISVHYRDAQIKDVLMDMEINHGLKFYYSSGRVPVDARVNIQMKDKKISEVLTEMFKHTDVEFVDLNGKIVLRKSAKKKTSAIRSSKKAVTEEIQSLADTPITYSGLETASLLPVFTEEELKNVPVISERLFEVDFTEDTSRSLPELKNRQLKKYMAVRSRLNKIGNEGAIRELKESYEKAESILRAKLDSLQANAAELRNRHNGDSLHSFPVHLSIVYPLSTKGPGSKNTVNSLSVNLFDGYSGALEGAEFGAVMNREKQYVEGAQFAGAVNLVGGPVTGLQCAGTANINNGMMNGAQYAGVVNVNNDTAYGMQAAGIVNVNNGSMMGAGMAGIVNFNKGGMDGFQAAGITNVNLGTTRGVMCAGVVNLSKEEHTGVQLAGIVNKAHRVRGSQIGLINIADTVTGATLGLINIIKKGYNKVEVYGGEAMYANVGVRLGAHKLHTILAAGFKPGTGDHSPIIGLGSGVGSVLRLSANTHLNFDLMTYMLQEGTEKWTEDLNMLNQLRVQVVTRITGQIYGFVGPSFNVSVSQYKETPSSQPGSSLFSGSLYDYTGESSSERQAINIKAWIGLNAGIRF